ncbi:MAG: hypothetical protein EBU90_01550 [Proteobacteria bacterium]|nr:hypothetical protein [Pseudomonadota bacterium]
MATTASVIEESNDSPDDFLSELVKKEVNQDPAEEIQQNQIVNDDFEEDDEEDEEVKDEDSSLQSTSNVETKYPDSEQTSVNQLLESFTEYLFIPEEGVDVTNKEEVGKLVDYHNNNVIDTFISQTKENLSPKESMILEALVSGVPLDEIDLDFQAVDYSKVDETDPENQNALVMDYYLNVLDMDEEDAELTVSAMSPEVLQKFAVKAKMSLSDLQVSELRKLQEDEKRNQELAEAREREQLQAFKNKILSLDEVAGIKLSQDEKLAVYDYYTKPVKDGKTQDQLDQSNIDTIVLRAHMNINKISLATIEKKAETKVVKQLLRIGSSEQNQSGTTAPGKSRIATTENTTFAYEQL